MAITRQHAYPGVKGIWAVHHTEAIDSVTQLTPQGGQHHTYLLMSHPASSETKVLETGEELSEVPVDRCGFVLDSPTIAAGNVLNNSLIVQASAGLCWLCCAVLCWAGLCCAVLCCAVLCCAVLCCAALRCAVLCCAVLRCAALCCAVLCCAVLRCAALRLCFGTNHIFHLSSPCSSLAAL